MISKTIDKIRFQLRTEGDGTGLLIINASAVLHLDKVATAYWLSFLNRSDDTGLLSKLVRVDALVAFDVFRQFKVSLTEARHDWDQLKERVWGVARGDLCPFSEGGMGRIEPFSEDLLAPYRVDLALTYLCNNNCSHCYAGGSREMAELSTTQWKTIIEKLHAFQVPQLVFTGGESLMREDLDELIHFAEELGLVTGLITNGRLLTREKCAVLAQAGLDYVQITIESDQASVHDSMVGCEAFGETVEGIKNALAAGIYTTTNMTLTEHNLETLFSTIPFLADLGVKKFGINAVINAGRGTSTTALTPDELKPLLREVLSLAHQLDMEFTWFTPTCYCDLNPVDMGLGIKTCSAARTVLAIEPDGNVMPCQSYFQSLGNSLLDSMEDIWQHPLALKLRRREIVSPKCHKCHKFSICGSGCPLDVSQNTVEQ